MDVREKLIEILRKPIFPHELVDPTEAVADYLLDNGVTVQEWISVEDELPEDQEEVLVLTQSKNGVRNVDKGYWAIDHFIHRGRSEVTHWMPMPEPPEMGKMEE